MQENYTPTFFQKLFAVCLAFLLIQVSGLPVASAQTGATWLEQNSGYTVLNRGISSLDAVNENVAWAVTYDATSGRPINSYEFTRTVNGGATWTKGTIGTDQTAVITNISALSATEAWAAVWANNANSTRGIFHTTDGGQTWTKQTTALYNSASSFVNWVTFADANNGVTGGDPVDGYFELYTTTNGGQAWTRVPQANMPAALQDEYGLSDDFIRNGNHVWFGTTKGRIFRSADNGLTWTVVTPFADNVQVTQMALADNGSAIVVGVETTTNNLMVNRTTNRGTDWTGARSQTLGGVSPNEIAYVPGTISTFVVSGSFSTFRGSAYSKDGGVSWTRMDDVTHLEVDFVNPTTGWSGAFSKANGVGGMYKFSGNLAATLSGTAMGWTEKTNVFKETGRGITAMHVLNDNVLWAVPYNSTNPNLSRQEFIRTADGGTTWVNGTIAGLPADASIGNIWGTSALEAFASVIGENGIRGIYFTANGGESWTRQASATFSGSTSFPNFVTFSNTTNGVAGGDVVDGYFELYTTSNKGQTWTRVPQANMPAILQGEYGLTNDFTRNGDKVWFGTSHGRVFKSTNNGLNWTVSAPFASNVLVTDIAFADNGTGIAMGTENVTNFILVARTTDGGATWTTPEYQAPGGISANALVYVPGTVRTFVVSGARAGWNGSAYSIDGGATWTLLDQAVQHLEVAFSSPTNGWSGGFNRMFKFSGSLAGSVTGLADDMEARPVQVYPNPATTELAITTTIASKDARVQLYNMSGQMVLEQALPATGKTIKVGHLAKGLYVLHVVDHKKVVKQKVVIQ